MAPYAARGAEHGAVPQPADDDAGRWPCAFCGKPGAAEWLDTYGLYSGLACSLQHARLAKLPGLDGYERDPGEPFEEEAV